MGNLTIDTTKCRRDSICVTICPARLIELQGREAFPQHIDGALSLCLDCYHCVAACPEGALAIGNVDAGACSPLPTDGGLLPTQLRDFLRSRRSIRSFKRDPLAPEKIAELLDVADHAPAGHNRRELRWTVVNSAETVQRLAGMAIAWTHSVIKEQPNMAQMFHLERLVQGWEAGLDPVCRHAPHIIIACSSKYSPLAQSAATIALSYLEIAAHSAGIGACWAGYLHIAVGSWKPLQEELSLGKNEAVYGAMMVGWPRYRYHRMPPRPRAEVTYL